MRLPYAEPSPSALTAAPSIVTIRCMVAHSGVSILERRRLLIDGAVQGVGFRPFVYNLASRERLTGFVANTSQGVAIEVQGPATTLQHFAHALLTQAPPLAQPRIARVETRHLLPDETSFNIQLSRDGPARRLVITPDAATGVTLTLCGL